jgi:Flp pilus assembly protein TadD
MKWTRRHRTLSASGTVVLFSALGLLWVNAVRAKRTRDHRETLHTKALYAIEMGDMDEAVAWIAQADELDSSDPTGHLILATGFARGGRKPRSMRRSHGHARAVFPRNPASSRPPSTTPPLLCLLSLNDASRYAERSAHRDRCRAGSQALLARVRALPAVQRPGRFGRSDEALVELQGHVRPSEPLFTLLEALVSRPRRHARR